MITMTTNLDNGPNDPENEKFSVGIPRVRPIPPKAETSSKTKYDQWLVFTSIYDDRFYIPIRNTLNQGALASSIILVRSMMHMMKMPHTSHQIS